MAVSVDQFVRELRSFDDRRIVVKTMRRRIAKPLPAVRKKVREHAIAILPHAGGLGKWTAKSTIGVRIRYASARSAGVTVRGSRKSVAQASDLTRLDAGTVRAPSWGHRGRGAWHSQSVPSGWFTDPVADADDWRQVIDQAVDEAFDTIRRG